VSADLGLDENTSLIEPSTLAFSVAPRLRARAW
jgi:hypothetical protein